MDRPSRDSTREHILPNWIVKLLQSFWALLTLSLGCRRAEAGRTTEPLHGGSGDEFELTLDEESESQASQRYIRHMLSLRSTRCIRYKIGRAHV